MKLIYRKASGIMILLLLAQFVSCSERENVTPETTEPDVTVSESQQNEYDFADLDFGGSEFNFLNTVTNWGFYYSIDFEEETGEKLDDAIYARNRLVEEKYNFILSVTEDDYANTATTIYNLVMAGDNQYQAALLPPETLTPLLSDNCFVNLSDISELQLDMPWWDNARNEISSIGNSDKLYFAASDFSLVGIEGIMCTFINKRMMSELGQEMPYQQVRDGKWTLDAMYELMKLGASLNGDESFEWKYDGSSIYGLVGGDGSIRGLIDGAGASFVVKGDDGLPQIAFEDEHFFEVAEKITTMMSQDGEWLHLGLNQERDHYEVAFANSRALMTVAEIKGSSRMRDMVDDYGIVPNPKYDESQEEYYAYVPSHCPAFCIPTTNTEPNKISAIMDALSYYSYHNVVPVFYDESLSQKRLRDEESIEMLSLMREIRHFDLGTCYGWTNQLQIQTSNEMMKNTGSLSSLLAENKEMIIESINKTLDELVTD